MKKLLYPLYGLSLIFMWGSFYYALFNPVEAQIVRLSQNKMEPAFVFFCLSTLLIIFILWIIYKDKKKERISQKNLTSNFVVIGVSILGTVVFHQIFKDNPYVEFFVLVIYSTLMYIWIGFQYLTCSKKQKDQCL